MMIKNFDEFVNGNRQITEGLDSFAHNLLDAIEKSRITTLDKFLTALSIPQCGKSTCKDLAKYCHGNIDEFIFKIVI